MTSAPIFLIDTFSTLYLIILLLRFWLPILRARFQNSIAQGVIRFTAPVVTPVRRFVPSIGRLDTATVLIAFVIQLLALVAIAALSSSPFSEGMILYLCTLAFFKLASVSVTIFIVAVIVRVVLNLLGRYFGPISDLLVDLTEPLLQPIRRVVPALGVLDLSAYICVVLLFALSMLLGDIQARL